MGKKVCAVIVTYNRKELLIRNIRSLLKQTYPLDILIYDNASTDGTYDYLLKENILSLQNVIYRNSERNLGGSGGFCNGEKIASNLGYDFLWLMDDDGYCINEYTLENCVMTILKSPKKTICNSLVVCDEKELVLTFGLNNCKTYEELAKYSIDGVYYGYGNPYNGTLVPVECFREVGYTDERFFIYGDENDFYIRSNRLGYEWITPLNSLYYHPVNRNIIRVFSYKNHKFEAKDQPIWKWYLESRNLMYIRLEHYNMNISFRHILKTIWISLNSKDHRIKRLYYGFLGLYDARQKNFDRPIMFDK